MANIKTKILNLEPTIRQETPGLSPARVDHLQNLKAWPALLVVRTQ